jgi:hypothetical protein
MQVGSGLKCGAVVLATVASIASAMSAGATTLMRAGLDDLVAANRTIVVGEIVDAKSYWNKDHTFILTDVRVALDDVLKGKVGGKELTLTVMGGRVGDLTTVIVGGPELARGSSYVLFLNEERLPGLEHALTIRDLSQGTFDVEIGRGGLRAVSQASRHPLLPDRSGFTEAPGGSEGLPFVDMMHTIRDIADRQRDRQEVQ